MGYNFDGINDGLYDDFAGTETYGANGFSVSFFFRTTKSTGLHSPVGYYNGSAVIYQVYANSGNNYVADDLNWYFLLRCDSNQVQRYTTGDLPGVVDGNWHHMVLVYDPRRGTDERQRIYVDGVKVNGTSHTSSSGGSGLTFAGSLGVGCQHQPHTNTRNDFWNGDLAEFCTWDYALDGEDVRNLYWGVLTEVTLRAADRIWYVPLESDKEEKIEPLTWSDNDSATLLGSHPSRAGARSDIELKLWKGAVQPQIAGVVTGNVIYLDKGAVQPTQPATGFITRGALPLRGFTDGAEAIVIDAIARGALIPVGRMTTFTGPLGTMVRKVELTARFDLRIEFDGGVLQ